MLIFTCYDATSCQNSIHKNGSWTIDAGEGHIVNTLCRRRMINATHVAMLFNCEAGNYVQKFCSVQTAICQKGYRLSSISKTQICDSYLAFTVYEDNMNYHRIFHSCFDVLC